MLVATVRTGTASGQVEITFLDVGQGDAILIRSAEGNTALIDAGPSPEVVYPLRAAGVTQLDIVIASHAHDDHIGGMPAVLRAFPVGQFFDNGLSSSNEAFHELVSELARLGVPRLVGSGQTLSLGTVTLRMLPLPRQMESVNDYSVGVLLEYGTFRALFTGDSETAEIHHFLEHGVPTVTLLKAAHHGSRNGVTPQWVYRTRASVVVISVGSDNAYGHPDEWALRYYQRYAHDILRTDRDGTVTVTGMRDGSYRTSTAAGTQAAGPGRQMSPTPKQTTAPPVRLEVYANPPGNDNDRLNDEYVVIGSAQEQPVAIGGWSLCDAARHCFEFPEGTSIPVAGAVFVHTGFGVADGTNFYYRRRQAVWNNDGDTATLFNRDGRLVVSVSY